MSFTKIRGIWMWCLVDSSFGRKEGKKASKKKKGK